MADVPKQSGIAWPGSLQLIQELAATPVVGPVLTAYRQAGHPLGRASAISWPDTGASWTGHGVAYLTTPPSRRTLAVRAEVADMVDLLATMLTEGDALLPSLPNDFDGYMVSLASAGAGLRLAAALHLRAVGDDAHVDSPFAQSDLATDMMVRAVADLLALAIVPCHWTDDRPVISQAALLGSLDEVRKITDTRAAFDTLDGFCAEDVVLHCLSERVSWDVPDLAHTLRTLMGAWVPIEDGTLPRPTTLAEAAATKLGLTVNWTTPRSTHDSRTTEEDRGRSDGHAPDGG